MAEKPSGATVAILLGVYATFALDVYSTLNSSPQTTELFSKDRESTLMHWVVIGDVVALGGGAAGSLFTGNVWPLVAAGLVMAMMHSLYRHAVKRGQGVAPPSNSDSGSSYGGY